MAEDILPEQRALTDFRPAFLLGSTAPDVQAVSGQDRYETHFFDLPLQTNGAPPWERFFTAHLSSQGGDQLAFLLGYGCHLQADWFWVRDIFAPVFGPGCEWGTFQHRLYLHNVLRAYLDRQILSSLPGDLTHALDHARPSGWLSFVSDAHLVQWRTWLAHQLSPGGAAQTVEVLAARQGIPVQEFYSLLDSEERLEEEIFSRLPRAHLEEYRRNVLEENGKILQAHLDPGFSNLKVGPQGAAHEGH